MKYIILSISFMCLLTVAKAQVSIGSPSPDAKSVLDLTNPSNKGLLLPKAGATPSLSMASPEGMVYFYEGDIYYNTGSRYNALSPWIYKVNNTSNHIYYNLGYIGIGSADSTVPPEAPLHLVTSQNVNLTTNGAFQIGETIGNNLVLNTNEIQARNSGSANTLTINEDGGLLQVGSSATPADVKVSGAVKVSSTVKQLHKPTDSYHDLLPQGAIIMWHKAAIPKGWAFCDGGSYPASDGSGNVTTPDLKDRFIVGRISATTPGAAGGTNARSHTITSAQMPSHTHEVTDPGHEHSFTSLNDINQTKVGGGNDLEGYDIKYNQPKFTTAVKTKITIQATGGGQAFTYNVKPKHFELAYIMKL